MNKTEMNDLGYYDIKERKKIIYINKYDGHKTERYVCPECIKHEQDEPKRGNDCKNVFIKRKDGKISESIAQCSCYSQEHEYKEEPKYEFPKPKLSLDEGIALPDMKEINLLGKSMKYKKEGDDV